MTFMLFWKEKVDNKLYYVNDKDEFKLAGNREGLIYRTWIKRGKPVNEGWTVTADELIQIYAEEFNYTDYNGNVYSLIIDFHPSSEDRIGLLEIERIHIYTYGDDEYVEWSPLMLELREVYNNSNIENFSKNLKEGLLERVEVKPDQEQIIEFLYLNGEDYTWNWGKNGRTNAVFLHKPARDFFRNFF